MLDIKFSHPNNAISMDPRPIPCPLGDSESKEAIVVDPGGDVEKILAKLRSHDRWIPLRLVEMAYPAW